MKLNYWYIRNRRKLSQHDKGHLQKKKNPLKLRLYLTLKTE